MNGPSRLAMLSGLTDAERGRPRLIACGVGRRLLQGDWPCIFSSDADEAFDGLIIADVKAAREAETLLRERRAWLTPVVDLTAEHLWFADCFADSATSSSLRSGVERALDILASLGRLPAAVLEADDRETVLLARVYSRGQRLEPTYDGAEPRLLRYALAGLIEQPAETAERLSQGGWFSRTFFDRLHFCPACNSSRLNVREECSACRSADLREESIVNHFRCAHQALERQFTQGETLICPKCRQRLRHFGVDYDRPGSATVCRACGHVDAEAAIGFLCIDCGAKADAAGVSTRDWCAYALTDLGPLRLSPSFGMSCCSTCLAIPSASWRLPQANSFVSASGRGTGTPSRSLPSCWRATTSGKLFVDASSRCGNRHMIGSKSSVSTTVRAMV
jgi:hypothetical protein